MFRSRSKRRDQSKDRSKEDKKVKAYNKQDLNGKLGLEIQSSSYLYDGTAVRSDAEIDLLHLLIQHFPGYICHWETFCLQAPACLIEKVTLWEGILYIKLRSKTDEGVAKVLARTGN